MTGKATHGREQTFGIGAVARMTGLTDHTIRVWERRYKAVDARRSANGRRFYRSADVEKLKLLKLLTDHGLSIGRIAGESLEALKARAQEVRELSAPAEPVEDISVAILGELLPALIKAEQQQLGPVKVIAADSQEDRLLADLEDRALDVLVVELPVIKADTGERLEALKSAAGGAPIVCIYSFARSADAGELRESGVLLLRAPITVDEAVQAIMRAARNDKEPNPVTPFPDAAPEDESALDDGGAIEPRRFTQHQLTELSNTSSTIECECPQHLAQLVGALSAFEIYSANCANRDEKDAALHRYLHRTTARARSLIEQALERVAREEGLI